MKIGYPCINRTLAVRTDKTFRLASFTPDLFRATVAENLAGLSKVLDYNREKGFLFFRISSETIPFASHPICKIDWVQEFQKELKALGEKVRTAGMRISMHPDQFVLINAKDPGIVSRSIGDLAWHARFLEAMGLGTNAKVQIHVGGVYGDKPSALGRFVETYKALSAEIRSRLVIENDERLFSLRDCLHLHEKTGVPILLDSFHHSCLNNGEPLREAIASAQKTWGKPDGVLMMDYSSQKAGARMGAHRESIDEEDFRSFVKVAKGMELDVMLEIKDKEASALKALAIRDSVK